MIKKITLLFFISSFISNIYSQKSPSDYSYVVVPDLYDFLYEVDQHQLNSMTKFLFNKFGFNAYFPTELPNVKRCDGLQAEVLGKPGFIYTKITVVLKDCYGEEVYRSEEGRSKYKEYKKAYQDALRKSFESIAALDVQQKEIKAYKDDVKNDMQPTQGASDDDNPKITSGTGTKISATGLTNFPDAKFTSYMLNGKSYLLRKTAEGYSLYQESENAPNGLLLMGMIVTRNEGAVYTTTDGKEYSAEFNSSGDLVIESSGGFQTHYKVQN